jgi:ABC-type glucose/galactose transport system permease subunit
MVAGALLLAAVAHVNVIAAGGYGTPQSWVTLAIAFGVACAAIRSGTAWSAGRRQLAVAIVVSIVAGESLWAHRHGGEADRQP